MYIHNRCCKWPMLVLFAREKIHIFSNGFTFRFDKNSFMMSEFKSVIDAKDDA